MEREYEWIAVRGSTLVDYLQKKYRYCGDENVIKAFLSHFEMEEVCDNSGLRGIDLYFLRGTNDEHTLYVPFDLPDQTKNSFYYWTNSSYYCPVRCILQSTSIN